LLLPIGTAETAMMPDCRQLVHVASGLPMDPRCASRHSELVNGHCDAGLAAHDLHQHPNPLLGGYRLDCSHEICKRARRKANLIARLQKLGRQQLARRITPQHELADDVERHRCGFCAEADEAGDAICGTDCPPKPSAWIECNKDVARKQRARRGYERSTDPLRAILHR
jgi:hypothetical protein